MSLKLTATLLGSECYGDVTWFQSLISNRPCRERHGPNDRPWVGCVRDSSAPDSLRRMRYWLQYVAAVRIRWSGNERPSESAEENTKIGLQQPQRAPGGDLEQVRRT